MDKFPGFELRHIKRQALRLAYWLASLSRHGEYWSAKEWKLLRKLATVSVVALSTCLAPHLSPFTHTEIWPSNKRQAVGGVPASVPWSYRHCHPVAGLEARWQQRQSSTPLVCHSGLLTDCLVQDLYTDPSKVPVAFTGRGVIWSIKAIRRLRLLGHVSVCMALSFLVLTWSPPSASWVHPWHITVEEVLTVPPRPYWRCLSDEG